MINDSFLGYPSTSIKDWIKSHITTKHYVQDSLVAMWDGIENVSRGVHDPNITNWTDVVNGL
jgi:hypothetical protein